MHGCTATRLHGCVAQWGPVLGPTPCLTPCVEYRSHRTLHLPRSATPLSPPLYRAVLESRAHVPRDLARPSPSVPRTAFPPHSHRIATAFTTPFRPCSPPTSHPASTASHVPATAWPRRAPLALPSGTSPPPSRLRPAAHCHRRQGPARSLARIPDTVPLDVDTSRAARADPLLGPRRSPPPSA